ncbi:hypothetical protein C8R44DRAFT_893987 [Mycena epipterygia]|nr:hypothetical protein C8R44DRAFT_893987 [Mycena epipterygia]
MPQNPTPGVPQMQEELQSPIANFARQGLTQTEMIGLIVCGHTFGGVQHDTFPTIVLEMNNTNNTLSVAHFDSAFVTFDNNVATEYVSGTTQNPLVVGLNDTTNSDRRIFGSDSDATMASFAKSPELFASTCADLFTRITDTVPSGLWNMTADATRSVHMLWDDHAGGTHNVSLLPSGITTSSANRHSAA